jgi:TonB family protein
MRRVFLACLMGMFLLFCSNVKDVRADGDVAEEQKASLPEREKKERGEKAEKALREALDEIRRQAEKGLPQVIGQEIPRSQSDRTGLEEYCDLVWNRIGEEWTLPEELPKDGKPLEVIVVVVLGKDGRIQNLWIEKPSGLASYDEAAMKTVKKAEPFPPFPKEIREDSLEIGLRFRPD